ncbi:S1 family peptidase [Sphingomonas sp. M1A8_2b]
MPELTVFEKLLYSTVKITVQRGQSTSTGTGFFYAVDFGGGQNVPLLVTNKHVLSQGGVASIWCHERVGGSELKSSGIVKQVILNIPAGSTIEHPDPNIDLCAVPFSDILNQAEAAGKPLLFIPLSLDIIPQGDKWSEFDALEEVIMIGCPNGIYDTVNYNPIIRQGITATPLAQKYLGKPEFMVDMACFPGSSGSPILLVNQTGYRDKATGSFMMGSGRVFFLGILYAGPLITNQGNIVLGQAPQVVTNTMMHLGNAIRSSEMIEIENLVRKIIKSQSEAASGLPGSPSL